MAEDEKRSRPPPSIPSLLAGRSSSADEPQSSRILAALEGRVPDAEVKHLAPKTRSKTPLVILLLLFLGAAGAGLWAVHDIAPLPVVTASIDAGKPAASALPEASSATAANRAAAAAQARAPVAAEPSPSSAASIVDDHPLAQLTQPDAQADTRVPANPLAALAVTTPAPKPAAAPPQAASSKGAGPTTQRAREGAGATAVAAASPKTAPARGKATPRNDADAALLATLMSYGLPPASPPGTKVYKTDGIFMRELPGASLATRLAECRTLDFLQSEQCRLRVCAGHWGTAPECPNAQAHIEP